jgi:RIO kinase 1
LSQATAAEHFIDEGLVDTVIRPIQSGKEATVLLCRANHRTTGVDLAALKVFHPRERRDFRDESIYRAGEWIEDKRAAKAVRQRTRFGRRAAAMVWVDREWITLGALHAAGAPVPRPIAHSGEAILMTYIGDELAAAPQLRSHRISDPDEAGRLLDLVLGAIATMLRADVVHGDLSPYNVLVWRGGITVIDMPQAVDPRVNDYAEELLHRDVTRVCEWAGRHGVFRDAEEIAGDLWTSWMLADLVPEHLRGL